MYLPGFFADELDQRRHAVDAEAGVDRERARLRHQHGDQRKVLARVVGQVREQQRVDGERAADADADGGAVRRCLGHRVGAGIAARSRPVLDDEGLSGFLLELIGKEPRHHVGRRSGAERHDDADRFRRPVLRAASR